jgi:hypothetical protein
MTKRKKERKKASATGTKVFRGKKWLKAAHHIMTKNFVGSCHI